ncbi:MerR family transcriptional regulator [Kitasatospora azatica]|uniref:MerR family transcriptional regulator n=1 Tax=Kitasatospora azatica TaxID=58347 RepID=UPI00056A5F50|nr:MerR family transcriptional regulator [Kitasatospora azatica]
MRLADLSERSQVSIATIKYYLREGLLPPGRRINATQAEYDESHLRRLRLVRAMIQVGRIPVATVREVLAHVDDESLGRTIRLGAALWALPRAAELAQDDPDVTAARRQVDLMLEQLGWTDAAELGELSPIYRELVASVASLARLGYPLEAEDLVPYAEQMAETAALDLDRMERQPTPVEQVEIAVASAVLFEPVLLSLRRLAQEQEATRRFGL